MQVSSASATAVSPGRRFPAPAGGGGAALVTMSRSGGCVVEQEPGDLGGDGGHEMPFDWWSRLPTVAYRCGKSVEAPLSPSGIRSKRDLGVDAGHADRSVQEGRRNRRPLRWP